MLKLPKMLKTVCVSKKVRVPNPGLSLAMNVVRTSSYNDPGGGSKQTKICGKVNVKLKCYIIDLLLDKCIMLKLSPHWSKKRFKRHHLEVINVKYKPYSYCMKVRLLRKADVFNYMLELISKQWKLSPNNY